MRGGVGDMPLTREERVLVQEIAKRLVRLRREEQRELKDMLGWVPKEWPYRVYLLESEGGDMMVERARQIERQGVPKGWRIVGAVLVGERGKGVREAEALLREAGYL